MRLKDVTEESSVHSNISVTQLLKIGVPYAEALDTQQCSAQEGVEAMIPPDIKHGTGTEHRTA